MPSAFPRVAVTGSSGFIGHAAARRFLAEGREVFALLRSEARMWRFRDIPPGLAVQPCDLLDPDSVRAALLAIRPDAVIHCGAYGAYERESDAERIVRTNVLGTHVLLAVAREAGVRLFVNAGSSSEYGFRDTPMGETDRLEPNSIYAMAKAAQTHLCLLAAREGPMAVVAFRIFSAYGAWEDPGRLLPTLIRRARAGEPLEMAAPDSVHDFVFIDDVLDALCDLERITDHSGELFNLGTGIESDLRAVVAAVRDAVGSRSEVVWHARPPRVWDARHWRCDPAKVRERLGWRARVDLRNGVSRMSEWMAQMGDRYGPA